MPVLSKDSWDMLRAEREAGASINGLAKKYNINRRAIYNKILREGWDDGSEFAGDIRSRIAEKVSGVSRLVLPSDPAKRSEAIEAAAERVTKVLGHHQEEWEAHRKKFGEIPKDFEIGKHAKISAEIILIRQRGERIAHGVDVALTAVEQATPAISKIELVGVVNNQQIIIQHSESDDGKDTATG